MLNIFKNSINLFLLSTLYKQNNTQYKSHKFELICWIL